MELFLIFIFSFVKNVILYDNDWVDWAINDIEDHDYLSSAIQYTNPSIRMIINSLATNGETIPKSVLVAKNKKKLNPISKPKGSIKSHRKNPSRDLVFNNLKKLTKNIKEKDKRPWNDGKYVINLKKGEKLNDEDDKQHQEKIEGNPEKDRKNQEKIKGDQEKTKENPGNTKENQENTKEIKKKNEKEKSEDNSSTNHDGKKDGKVETSKEVIETTQPKRIHHKSSSRRNGLRPRHPRNSVKKALKEEPHYDPVLNSTNPNSTTIINQTSEAESEPREVSINKREVTEVKPNNGLKSCLRRLLEVHYSIFDIYGTYRTSNLVNRVRLFDELQQKTILFWELYRQAAASSCASIRMEPDVYIISEDQKEVTLPTLPILSNEDLPIFNSLYKPVENTPQNPTENNVDDFSKTTTAIGLESPTTTSTTKPPIRPYEDANNNNVAHEPLPVQDYQPESRGTLPPTIQNWEGFQSDQSYNRKVDIPDNEQYYKDGEGGVETPPSEEPQLQPQELAQPQPQEVSQQLPTPPPQLLPVQQPFTEPISTQKTPFRKMIYHSSDGGQIPTNDNDPRSLRSIEEISLLVKSRLRMNGHL